MVVLICIFLFTKLSNLMFIVHLWLFFCEMLFLSFAQYFLLCCLFLCFILRNTSFLLQCSSICKPFPCFVFLEQGHEDDIIVSLHFKVFLCVSRKTPNSNLKSDKAMCKSKIQLHVIFYICNHYMMLRKWKDARVHQFLLKEKWKLLREL